MTKMSELEQPGSIPESKSFRSLKAVFGLVTLASRFCSDYPD